MTLSLDEPGTAPAAAPRIRRFEPVERFAHWWIAGLFLMTAASGGALGEDWDGSLNAVMVWHVASAVALVIGALILPLLPGRRVLWSSLRSLLHLDAVDRAALAEPSRMLPGVPADRVPRWGRFNVGQKAVAWALPVLVAVTYATGIAVLAWGVGLGLAHNAFVSLTMLIVAGHIFLAAIYPSTRPALRGMLTGWVDRAWAVHHHPAWVAQVEAAGGAVPHGQAPGAGS